MSVLKEILRWTKFSGMQSVRAVLETNLDDNQKRSIYQLSDGTKGTEEIASLVRAGAETVRRYWIAWQKLGFGDYVPARGGKRFKRSFDLEEVGIEVTVPENPQSNHKSATSQQRPASNLIESTLDNVSTQTGGASQ